MPQVQMLCSSCESLGKLPNLFVFLCPPVYNGSNRNTLVILLLFDYSESTVLWCMGSAGYYYSSACSYITDAPTVTLPGMHLACLTTEKELCLGSAESEGIENSEMHLFNFSFPGPKELKAPFTCLSLLPLVGQRCREYKEVRQKEASPPFLCISSPKFSIKNVSPPPSQSQAPNRA